MKLSNVKHTIIASCLAAMALSGGCRSQHGPPQILKYAHMPPPPAKNGAALEALWQRQEANAEASDFVLNEHDFKDMDSVELNASGRDHLKMVALRCLAGAPFPVVVERSKYSLDPEAGEDDYNYPIHHDPVLDDTRREAVARVLAEMGVPYADQRVLVGEPYTDPETSNQAAINYGRFNSAANSFFGNGFGPGGLNNGFGGIGGGGFGGGFGGGGFGGGFF